MIYTENIKTCKTCRIRKTLCRTGKVVGFYTKLDYKPSLKLKIIIQKSNFMFHVSSKKSDTKVRV